MKHTPKLRTATRLTGKLDFESCGSRNTRKNSNNNTGVSWCVTREKRAPDNEGLTHM